MNKRHASYGFTLIELVFTIFVLVIVVTVALPVLRDTIQTNNLVANSNQLAAAFKYARTEALKRRASVTVCGLNAAKTACSTTTDWSTNGFGVLDSGSTVLKKWLDPTQYSDITITSSSASIVYAASGMLNNGADIGVRISFSAISNERCLEISTTGRVHTKQITSGDSCP